MRTLVNKCPAILLTTILSLSIFSSCTKEYYTDEHITNEYYGTQSVNEFFTVGGQNNPNQWSWDSEAARYECAIRFDKLTRDIYDYGSIVGSVFVNPGQDNIEWLEMLPYQAVYYYIDDNDQIVPYLVNISCAFTPGEVKFFIAPSDRFRDDDQLLDAYEFKVTLLWDEYNIP